MGTLDQVHPLSAAVDTGAPAAARLLVAVADAQIAALAAELLSEAGYVVSVMKPDALALELSLCGFDVAVIDESDATAADASLVRALAPRGRVLVLAGYGDLVTALALLRAGASDYLVMPLEGPERFLASVAALVSGPTPDGARLARIDPKRLPVGIREAVAALRAELVSALPG